VITEKTDPPRQLQNCRQPRRLRSNPAQFFVISASFVFKFPFQNSGLGRPLKKSGVSMRILRKTFAPRTPVT
jgi:hypothetical protein